MKIVSVYDAVGMVLCHDLTSIVPGKEKKVAFKKGHVVCEDDIPHLLNIGKEHLYVWDLSDGFVHEDDAAYRIAKAAAGRGLTFTEPHEGKIDFEAEYDGLLKINAKALYDVNSVKDIMFSSLHTDQKVMAKQRVAGTRIIPLVTENDNLVMVEKICAEAFPLIEIKPFKQNFKLGIVTTGSEVFNKRIPDGFGPVLRKKAEHYGVTVLDQVFTPDDAPTITEAIKSMVSRGADVVAVTGGMSVDPDDVTPLSIRNSGAEIEVYGVPVLPGAMFMLAYLDNAAIMGLPGCVMFNNTTILDIVFPLILAGERPTRSDLIAYAHGSYCLKCNVCHYPICGFGKR
ncbi:MAG: molybdopterin-binding protein [Leptospirales bacterium]|nr:molybdopterin-binding protein [Leptospirales bacterium]